jgi:hypothetical protein
MVWKYSRAAQARAEAVIAEAKEAAASSSSHDWKFYEETTEEYREGLRITFKL